MTKRLVGTMCCLMTTVALISVGCTEPRTKEAKEDKEDERIYQSGKQSYVYAYPLVLMEMTRRTMTNVPAPMPTGRAPVNHFGHMTQLATPELRIVVKPNVDTLYSSAWLDLSAGPMVLSVPDTGGRYYLTPMLDAWTEVFASPGKRTTGTAAARFAILGPGWKGAIPAGMRAIQAPTDMVWILGRTQLDGPADLAQAREIQQRLELMPLRQWGKAYSPPEIAPAKSSIDIDLSPPAQVERMDAATFFATVADLLADNPPHPADAPMIANLGAIGIEPGKPLDARTMSPRTARVLERAIRDARKDIAAHAQRMGTVENGWRILRENIGSYGTAYLDRAAVALIGLGANLPEDAIYPIAETDDQGQPLTGRERYGIHFGKDELPPVNAFWSVTLYDSEGFLVENPLNRYALGDRDDLRYNEDGSLDLYIQHDPPPAPLSSNWLPAPKGPFDLVMRLYWPKQQASSGTWAPPPVRRISPETRAKNL